MIYTTISIIKENNPCTSRYRHLISNLGSLSENDEFSYSRLLDINGLDDTLWALRAPVSKYLEQRNYILRKFLCSVAVENFKKIIIKNDTGEDKTICDLEYVSELIIGYFLENRDIDIETLQKSLDVVINSYKASLSPPEYASLFFIQEAAKNNIDDIWLISENQENWYTPIDIFVPSRSFTAFFPNNAKEIFRNLLHEV